MIYYWFFTWRARVPTGAMANTIIPGDQVLILKSFGQIERGSIVLFRYPDNPEFPKGEYFLGRAIGLPGAKDPEEEAAGNFATNSPFHIPNDNFFLLGDNRDNSFDSRYRGPVPREMIWGHAFMIYYSEAETPDKSIRWERVFKKVN